MNVFEYEQVRKRAAWIKNRCENPNHKMYKYYGGRGIEFRFSSYSEFVEYVVKLPNASLALDIDRINNDGHYEVGNIRWVTHKENLNNKRPTYDKPSNDWYFDFVRLYNDGASNREIMSVLNISVDEINSARYRALYRKDISSTQKRRKNNQPDLDEYTRLYKSGMRHTKIYKTMKISESYCRSLYQTLKADGVI